jgi:hypothetical protein
MGVEDDPLWLPGPNELVRGRQYFPKELPCDFRADGNLRDVNWRLWSKTDGTPLPENREKGFAASTINGKPVMGFICGHRNYDFFAVNNDGDYVRIYNDN